VKVYAGEVYAGGVCAGEVDGPEIALCIPASHDGDGGLDVGSRRSLGLGAIRLMRRPVLS
jgi:hypothetical protein